VSGAQQGVELAGDERVHGEKAEPGIALFVGVGLRALVSHRTADNLTLAGAARTVFLLLVVWWAWIYTTWMVNWFDPASGAVRLVLIGAALASLLVAAAHPERLRRTALFAFAYVAPQVGRNVAAVSLLGPDDALHGTFRVRAALGPPLAWARGRLRSPACAQPRVIAGR
jgi:hypothetical protein